MPKKTLGDLAAFDQFTYEAGGANVYSVSPDQTGGDGKVTVIGFSPFGGVIHLPKNTRVSRVR